MQPLSSIEDIFGGMFLDPIAGAQISTLNISEPSYNFDGALQDWRNEFVLSDTDPTGSAPFSSQETSHFSSLSPGSTGSVPFSSQEASQLSSLSPESTSSVSVPFSTQEALQLSSLSPASTSEDVIMLNDQDEICYGMVSERRNYAPRQLLTYNTSAAQCRRQICRRNASRPL